MQRNAGSARSWLMTFMQEMQKPWFHWTNSLSFHRRQMGNTWWWWYKRLPPSKHCLSAQLGAQGEASALPRLRCPGSAGGTLLTIDTSMHAFFFLFGPSNMGALFLKPGPGLGAAKENWEPLTPASANLGWSSRYLHQLTTCSRQQCHHTHTHTHTDHGTKHQVELPPKPTCELSLL
jgi:hypothetical protein